MDARSVVEKLFNSRKVWILLLCILCAAVLVGLGKIPADVFLDYVKWLATVVIGSAALEDAAHKFSLPAPTNTDTKQ